KDLSFDANGTRHPGRLEARVALPGACEEVAVVGTAVPFGPEKSLALDLELEGLAPKALAPYLARVGLEPALRHGRLAAHVAASAKAPAPEKLELAGEVAKLTLGDEGRKELAGLDSLKVAGAVLDRSARRLDLGSVSVVPPRARFGREPLGELEGLGFRTR